MIFTLEALLTRKWFSGSSCIRSNWNKLGVNFEEGGNRSARRKPSKSGWDWLKLNPHTTFIVEVEGIIDVHYASLTSQGVQQRVFYQRVTHPDINPIQQGLTSVNRWEPVFSLWWQPYPISVIIGMSKNNILPCWCFHNELNNSNNFSGPSRNLYIVPLVFFQRQQLYHYPVWVCQNCSFNVT